MQLIVNGAQVSYLERGVGTNLIFVHGWLDSKETFEPLIDNLSDSFRCIAVDLPNFGNSQQDLNIVTVKAYSEFLKDFIKKLNLKNYTVIGHSMGGQILVYGTGEGIIMPKKLVLIASAGIRDKQQLTKLVLKYVAKATKSLVPNNLRDFLYNKIGSDYRTNLSFVHKKIIKSILSTDIQQHATMVNCPTLLIYGDLDKHTPLSFGKLLHNNIKNSKLYTVRGKDHWVHKTAAKEVAAEIRKIINE